MKRSNEEIIRQLRRGANREVALSLLYQNNKPAIYKIAKKYGGYNNIDDLIQEGFIGLMRAVESYDPDHDSGASFFHYAMPWIIKSVTRSLAYYEPVRISEGERQRYFKYRNILSQREARGLPCDLSSMAKALNWTEKKTEEVQGYALMLSQASLETPVGSEEDTTLMDMIPSAENIEKMATEPLYLDYRKALLWNNVNKLPHEEREIITGHYRDGRTLVDLARELQLTPMQTQRKRENGLEKLRYNRDIRRLAKQENLVEAYEEVKKYPYHPVSTVMKKSTLDDLLKAHREEQEDELAEILKRLQEQNRGESDECETTL